MIRYHLIVMEKLFLLIGKEKNICNKTQCILSEIVPRSVSRACLYLSVSISSVFKFFLAFPISLSGYQLGFYFGYCLPH